MKVALIGIKDAWSSMLLYEEIKKQCDDCLFIDMQNNSDLVLNLPENTCYYQGENLTAYDIIFIKKIAPTYSRELHDRLQILMLLEKMGVKFFSSPKSINLLLNRLSCTRLLSEENLPLPPTIITENVNTAYDFLKKYKKVILKPLYTSKARGMEFLTFSSENKEENLSLIKKFQEKYTTIYMQKALNLSNASDLGIVFVGGEYLTTYARCKGKNTWNTSTLNGGHYEKFTPSQELIDIAYKAQKNFNLAFTCVDIALTPEPYIFEVSAFGGFKGIVETSSINPAKALVDYALNNLK